MKYYLRLSASAVELNRSGQASSRRLLQEFDGSTKVAARFPAFQAPDLASFVKKSIKTADVKVHRCG
jgi:hypothetical protein